MELDLSTAELRAREYIGATGPLLRLGWGIGGWVYLSPNAQTAIKVHRRIEGYRTEIQAYRLLSKHRLTNLHGLNIPKPRGKSDQLMTFHMDVVTAPYLLDFAGVRFTPPDFSADVMRDWQIGIANFFGPNAHVAYAVYDALRRLGMWYLDFRPSNLKLDGLPGLLPDEPSDLADENYSA